VEDDPQDGNYNTCPADEVQDVSLDFTGIQESNQEQGDSEFRNGEAHHSRNESDSVQFNSVQCC
jgi:hypothetical protein